jgi:hypothetical protein
MSVCKHALSGEARIPDTHPFAATKKKGGRKAAFFFLHPVFLKTTLLQ